MPSVAFSALGIFIYNNLTMLDSNTREILMQIKNHPFLMEQDDLEQANLEKTEGNLPRENAFFVQIQEELSKTIPNNTVTVEYLRVDSNNPNNILVSSAGSIDNKINFLFDEESAYLTTENLKLNDSSGQIVNSINSFWQYKFKPIVKEIKEAYSKNS